MIQHGREEKEKSSFEEEKEKIGLLHKAQAPRRYVGGAFAFLGDSDFFRILLLIADLVLSVVFLSLAIRKIPLGTGYAIWTGFGAVGLKILS